MKRKIFVVIMAAIAYSAGTATASTLLGPKGEFSSLVGLLEYDPSRGCVKPLRPSRHDDKYVWDNYYADAARDYVACLKRTSMKDMEYANDVVSDGYSKAVDRFLLEVERGY